MLKLLLLIGALIIGFPLIILFVKLILGILGITIGIVSLPLLIIGGIILLPIMIVFGLLTKLLPLILVGGLGYFAYRYIRNREYY